MAAVFLTLMLAQTPAAADPAEAARLERIRKALTEAPAIAALPVTRAEGNVFRVTVFGLKPEKPLWVDWSAVPTYIRPFAPPYHYEFLKEVTPEVFRGATLHPYGQINTQVIEFVVKQIKAANRKRQEANAKEEVRKALEELLACRANPERPGC
jgi:hypothetical protein